MSVKNTIESEDYRMGFDVKKIIDQVLEKLNGNGDMMAAFKKDPAKAVKSIVGVDIPDDTIDGIVDAVKVKLLGDEGGNLLGKLGGFLGKKE